MRIPAIFLSLFAATSSAVESHCSPQEQVVFSCTITKYSKVASLCASKPLGKNHGALAYRFGPIGKLEFSFPSTARGSLERFRHAHYFRYQTDRTEVSFSNGNYIYSVFDYYEGEEKVKNRQGVRVATRNAESRETELLCSSTLVSELQKLEGLVPCDEGNALASCN